MSSPNLPFNYRDPEYLNKNEEFNNFLVKVNEVNSIVQKLASKDTETAKIGDLEAKRYLGENDDNKNLDEVIEDDIRVEVKSNRTVINKKAFKDEPKDPNTMSQEAFMREVEQDADKRYKEKLIRKEKMETFKKQATKAFRRGEYEKALSLYNKAIEQIKDSVLLYNNRALTYINLKLYEKAEDDLGWALRLNEDCVKSWLLLAKSHFLQNKMEDYKNDIKEASERNPELEEFIQDYIKGLENEVKN